MRLPRWFFPWGLVGLGVVAVGALALAAAPDELDDGRPIIVVGDSYAVGLAAQLEKMFPGRVESRAVGGTASFVMSPLTDRNAFWVVSAGTNDAAGSSSAEKIASSVLRVLGPYGSGTATQGAAFYLVPPGTIGAVNLHARVDAVRPALLDAIAPNDRLAVGDTALVPAGPDHIHFSPDQYAAIAREAMRSLRELAGGAP